MPLHTFDFVISSPLPMCFNLSIHRYLQLRTWQGFVNKLMLHSRGWTLRSTSEARMQPRAKLLDCVVLLLVEVLGGGGESIYTFASQPQVTSLSTWAVDNSFIIDLIYCSTGCGLAVSTRGVHQSRSRECSRERPAANSKSGSPSWHHRLISQGRNKGS